MFLTVHSVAGAAIGEAAGNPLLAFLLGVLSHFVLDRIPHWDPHGYQGFQKEKIIIDKGAIQYASIAILDIILTSALVWFILTRNFSHPVPIFFGALGAVTPDFNMGFYFLTKNKIFKFLQDIHVKTHFRPGKTPVTFFSGNATQVLTLAFSLFALWMI